MSQITIPVPNLMIVRDQQGQQVGLPTSQRSGVPTIGSANSAWEGIGYVTRTDALGSYRVPSAFRNTQTGQTVANPNLRRPIQDVTDAFPERFAKPDKKPKPRPVRGGGQTPSLPGGGNPATITPGAGRPIPTFTGDPPVRIQQLNEALAQVGNGLTDPSGQLTPAAQAALIEGLDLDEFTPAIIGYLDPGNSVNFLVYEDGLGGRHYIAARLETPDSLARTNASLNLGPAMNFPTAYLYALLGFAIARSSWGDQYENGPTKWITHEGGAWFSNEAGVKTLLRNGDDPSLTGGDYMGQDWVVAGSPNLTVVAQPDFPVTPYVHNVPRIDVYAPAA